MQIDPKSNDKYPCKNRLEENRQAEEKVLRRQRQKLE